MYIYQFVYLQRKETPIFPLRENPLLLILKTSSYPPETLRPTFDFSLFPFCVLPRRRARDPSLLRVWLRRCVRDFFARQLGVCALRRFASFRSSRPLDRPPLHPREPTSWLGAWHPPAKHRPIRSPTFSSPLLLSGSTFLLQTPAPLSLARGSPWFHQQTHPYLHELLRRGAGTVRGTTTTPPPPPPPPLARGIRYAQKPRWRTISPRSFARRQAHRPK